MKIIRNLKTIQICSVLELLLLKSLPVLLFCLTTPRSDDDAVPVDK
jgi:hypothetical protein